MVENDTDIPQASSLIFSEAPLRPILGGKRGSFVVIIIIIIIMIITKPAHRLSVSLFPKKLGPDLH